MLVQPLNSARSSIHEINKSAHTARLRSAVTWTAKFHFSRKREGTYCCSSYSSVQDGSAPLLQNWQLTASLGFVKESQVAGYGVFAIQPIPQGAVVGGYPGLPRTAKGMLAKVRRVPRCQQYVFQISSDLWLDPTDNTGSPSSKLVGFMPFWTTDISMAYVNEPPVGQTVNVEISDATDSKNPELQFVATQNIDPGQELFIDYGNVYNRSSYNTEH